MDQNAKALHIDAYRERVADYCAATKMPPTRITRYRSGMLYDTQDIVWNGAGSDVWVPQTFFAMAHGGEMPLDWYTNGALNGQLPGDKGFRAEGLGVQVLMVNPAAVAIADQQAAMQAVANACVLTLNAGQDNQQKIGPVAAWLGASGGADGLQGGQGTCAPQSRPLLKPLNLLPNTAFSVGIDLRAGILPAGAGWASLTLAIRVFVTGIQFDLVAG